MKINRKVKLDLIIAHNEGQKWFQDEIEKIEEQNAIDNRVVKIMKEREGEWNTGTLANKRHEYARLLKDVRAEVEGGDA